MTAAPCIGITTAFDDGTGAGSLCPSIALNVVDATYVRAVERAGGAPLVLPVTTSEATVDSYLRTIDGLILSGGGWFVGRRYEGRDLPGLRELAPRRFRFETMLLRKALAMDLPILGICRGHQMIARVTGGRCYSQIDRRVPGARPHLVEGVPLGRRPVHSIVIVPGTKLFSIVGRTVVGVNSLHRQAVERVAPPFVVSARADDGIVEAIESREHRFVMGVQFHPELLVDEPAWHRLFQAFVGACAANRERETVSVTL